MAPQPEPRTLPCPGLAPAARVPSVLLSQCARANASAVSVSAGSASVWLMVASAPDDGARRRSWRPVGPWYWLQAGAAGRASSAYRRVACCGTCSQHAHWALAGARDATVRCARRMMAATGRARAAAAAARAPARFHRAARCAFKNGHQDRAMNAAQRAVMVKRACSMRSTLPMSCSAVTRRASAFRCARDARARQARLLETRASGGAVRQVVRRPALALTWQPAFVAPSRRAGAVLGAATRRSGARDAVPSGGRKKPASRVVDAPPHGAKQLAPTPTAERPRHRPTPRALAENARRGA
jgi:hypothetical protein